MRLAILSVMLFATAVLAAQEHAPSREQCKADSRLWDVAAHTAAVDKKLKIDELLARAQELMTCSVAYEDEIGHYWVLSDVYRSAYDSRVQDFFHRHPEVMRKFVVEDDAGLR